VSWQCLIAGVLAAVVINEVMFDPPGSDSGHEFVELYNPGPDPVDLEGFQLHFVNGTAPVPPEPVWRGDPHALAAGGFFVVGGDQVGERDRTTNLGLQNGDEALLLVRDGATVDAVAWGEDLGLGEGQPVLGGIGAAVGRVPDGRDSGDNRTDFRELPTPTPGGPNLAADRFDLAGWRAEPVWREDAGPLLLRVWLVATGWAERQHGVAEFWGDAHALALAAGDTTEIELIRDVQPGALEAELRVTIGGQVVIDEALPLWCGASDLTFTEVQPRPADGEPEWFELHNRGTAPLSMEGWGVRDRGGSSRELATNLIVEAGERVVFTADASRLAGFYGSSARILEPQGGWPTLNDTDPGGGAAADSLHLVSPDGAIVDLVTWRRSEIEERGRSLQRGRVEPGQASLWLPSVDGPTPGAVGEGEFRRWPQAGMVCGPDPFTPDGDGSGDELEILLTGFQVRAVSVFDLQGDVVRTLTVTRAGDRALARWDGTDTRGRPAPPGAWVIVAEPEGAGPVLRCVIGLGRAG
jgi:hypothetical protein